jgi:hypothetical protein
MSRSEVDINHPLAQVVDVTMLNRGENGNVPLSDRASDSTSLSNREGDNHAGEIEVNDEEEEEEGSGDSGDDRQSLDEDASSEVSEGEDLKVCSKEEYSLLCLFYILFFLYSELIRKI